MGIWRQSTERKRSQIKESYSLFENSDPFDQDEDSFLGSFRNTSARVADIRGGAASATAKSVLKKPAARSTKGSLTESLERPNEALDSLDADFSLWNKTRSARSIAVYGLLLAVVAMSGFALAKYKPWATWSSQELVYAYFELRAVDGAGRPVAGAVVKNAGKRVGTTDSFGEWRRYMRVPLGATVPITILKTGTSESQFAVKNFAVPPVKPDKSDMELRASVQLLPGGAATASQPSVANNASLSKESVASESVAAKRTDTKERDTLVGVHADVSPGQDAKSDQTKEIASVEPAVTSNTKSDKAPEDFVSSHESIWIEVANGSSTSLLQRSILPALLQRAKELGLKIDQNAQWRVKMTSLVEPPRTIGPDGAGLIAISTADGAGGTPTEFLRNYQSDVRNTARGILYVLAHQVNKNVALMQKSGRWVVALPKQSPELWRLAGGMSLASAGHVWLTGVEPYADADFQGYYLMNHAESPCGQGKTRCEVKTRSFAEIPAVPTWTRLKLRFSAGSKEKDSIKVFVSGYEAKPSGDNVWEYWGQDHARANVTVLQSGRLSRFQVFNDARQIVPVAASVVAVSRH